MELGPFLEHCLDAGSVYQHWTSEEEYKMKQWTTKHRQPNAQTSVDHEKNDSAVVVGGVINSSVATRLQEWPHTLKFERTIYKPHPPLNKPANNKSTLHTLSSSPSAATLVSHSSTTAVASTSHYVDDHDGDGEHEHESRPHSPTKAPSVISNASHVDTMVLPSKVFKSTEEFFQKMKEYSDQGPTWPSLQYKDCCPDLPFGLFSFSTVLTSFNSERDAEEEAGFSRRRAIQQRLKNMQELNKRKLIHANKVVIRKKEKEMKEAENKVETVDITNVQEDYDSLDYNKIFNIHVQLLPFERSILKERYVLYRETRKQVEEERAKQQQQQPSDSSPSTPSHRDSQQHLTLPTSSANAPSNTLTNDNNANTNNPSGATPNPVDEHDIVSAVLARLPHNRPPLQPYIEQGDPNMYDEPLLTERMKLRTHPKILKLMGKFWRTFSEKDSKHGLIKKEYVEVHVRMNKAINRDGASLDASNTDGPRKSTPFNVETAEACANRDWNRDTHRTMGNKSGLKQLAFLDAMFELVDVWTETTDVNEYVDFLTVLYNRITRKNVGKKKKKTNSAEGDGESKEMESGFMSWRNIKEIGYDGLGVDEIWNKFLQRERIRDKKLHSRTTSQLTHVDDQHDGSQQQRKPRSRRKSHKNHLRVSRGHSSISGSAAASANTSDNEYSDDEFMSDSGDGMDGMDGFDGDDVIGSVEHSGAPSRRRSASTAAASPSSQHPELSEWNESGADSDQDQDMLDQSFDSDLLSPASAAVRSKRRSTQRSKHSSKAASPYAPSVSLLSPTASSLSSPKFITPKFVSTRPEWRYTKVPDAGIAPRVLPSANVEIKAESKIDIGRRQSKLLSPPGTRRKKEKSSDNQLSPDGSPVNSDTLLSTTSPHQLQPSNSQTSTISETESVSSSIPEYGQTSHDVQQSDEEDEKISTSHSQPDVEATSHQPVPDMQHAASEPRDSSAHAAQTETVESQHVQSQQNIASDSHSDTHDAETHTDVKPRRKHLRVDTSLDGSPSLTITSFGGLQPLPPSESHHHTHSKPSHVATTPKSHSSRARAAIPAMLPLPSPVSVLISTPSSSVTRRGSVTVITMGSDHEQGWNDNQEPIDSQYNEEINNENVHSTPGQSSLSLSFDLPPVTAPQPPSSPLWTHIAREMALRAIARGDSPHHVVKINPLAERMQHVKDKVAVLSATLPRRSNPLIRAQAVRHESEVEREQREAERDEHLRREEKLQQQQHSPNSPVRVIMSPVQSPRSLGRRSSADPNSSERFVFDMQGVPDHFPMGSSSELDESSNSDMDSDLEQEQTYTPSYQLSSPTSPANRPLHWSVSPLQIELEKREVRRRKREARRQWKELLKSQKNAIATDTSLPQPIRPPRARVALQSHTGGNSTPSNVDLMIGNSSSPAQPAVAHPNKHHRVSSIASKWDANINQLEQTLHQLIITSKYVSPFHVNSHASTLASPPRHSNLQHDHGSDAQSLSSDSRLMVDTRKPGHQQESSTAGNVTRSPSPPARTAVSHVHVAAPSAPVQLPFKVLHEQPAPKLPELKIRTMQYEGHVSSSASQSPTDAGAHLVRHASRDWTGRYYEDINSAQHNIHNRSNDDNQQRNQGSKTARYTYESKIEQSPPMTHRASPPSKLTFTSSSPANNRASLSPRTMTLEASSPDSLSRLVRMKHVRHSKFITSSFLRAPPLESSASTNNSTNTHDYGGSHRTHKTPMSIVSSHAPQPVLIDKKPTPRTKSTSHTNSATHLSALSHFLRQHEQIQSDKQRIESAFSTLARPSPPPHSHPHIHPHALNVSSPIPSQLQRFLAETSPSTRVAQAGLMQLGYQARDIPRIK